MSTLQGVNFTNLNVSQNFILGIFLSSAFIFLGDKLNHLVKILSLSSIFTLVYVYINESAPIWYYIAVLLVILFFTHRLKKYNLNHDG